MIKAERMEEVPFDSDRKLMSISSRNHIYTKGAPDELLKEMYKHSYGHPKATAD